MGSRYGYRVQDLWGLGLGRAHLLSTSGVWAYYDRRPSTPLCPEPSRTQYILHDGPQTVKPINHKITPKYSDPNSTKGKHQGSPPDNLIIRPGCCRGLSRGGQTAECEMVRVSEVPRCFLFAHFLPLVFTLLGFSSLGPMELMNNLANARSKPIFIF